MSGCSVAHCNEAVRGWFKNSQFRFISQADRLQALRYKGMRVEYLILIFQHWKKSELSTCLLNKRLSESILWFSLGCLSRCHSISRGNYRLIGVASESDAYFPTILRSTVFSQLD